MAGRRSRRGHAAEFENEERWLLTYADMLTLMFALFMVLYSISSVNISKYESLQQSLKAAFSGSILSGGKAIIQSGSESTKAHTPATAEVPSIVPLTPNIPKPRDTTAAQISKAMLASSAAQQEQQSFKKLQRELNRYAKAHGFGNEVQAVIDRRGLVVHVLTDKLLFGSGSATIQSAGLPLLQEISHLLNVDQKHPITVEGNTDNQPIQSSQFPSNWELSAARASTVVRYLVSRGVDPLRLGATGYADMRPVASNASAQGRAQNRRVEVVLQRLH
jgi:chemotaxis protein MotB